jgi:hypothetical protein
MKKKLAIAIIGVLALLVLLGLANSWFTPTFKGGELTQGSLFSYPRYHGRLPTMDLGKNGRYSAIFSGFPVRDASIELELPHKTIKDFHQLTSLDSTLSLRIEDARGKTVCNASGQLNQISNIEHHWVSTGNDDFVWLGNSDCADFKLSSRDAYTLTVAVQGADGKTALPARPLLLGGGIELP